MNDEKFDKLPADAKIRIFKIAIARLEEDRAERTPAVNAEYGNGEFVDKLLCDAISELQIKIAQLEGNHAK